MPDSTLNDMTALLGADADADADLVYVADAGALDKKMTLRELARAMPFQGMAFKGCLVRPAADITSVDYSSSVSLPFDQETYDYGGWHDNSSNNTRITVPTGVSKVQLGGNVTIQNISSGNHVAVVISKNGAVFDGYSATRQELSAATAFQFNVVTPPVEVVAGDYFEIDVNIETDTSVDITATLTSFWANAIETTGSRASPRGALVTLAADLTTQDYTGGATAVAFDEELYDTDAIHDNSTNNSRLTVPAGVTHVRLSGQVAFAAGTNDTWHYLWMYKNGSSDWQGAPVTQQEVGRTTMNMNIISPILEVVAGDYFELFPRNETDTSVTLSDDQTWFAMEIVEPVLVQKEKFRGALVKPAADITTADYTTATDIPFDEEDYDTDAIHDNSTNNTRLTVPSGVSKVRLTGGVIITAMSVDEWTLLQVHKNGSNQWTGIASQQLDTTNTARYSSVSTPVVSVVPGDYFELNFRVETDTSITLEEWGTYFSMEIIE